MSGERQEVFAELDDLTDELVIRYREQRHARRRRADERASGDERADDHADARRAAPGARGPRSPSSASSSRPSARWPACRCAGWPSWPACRNPYLSQIERGLRRPSAEILQQLAKALKISAETLYVRAGLLTDEDDAAPSVREAIGRDPQLTPEQKQALLNVYESYVGS